MTYVHNAVNRSYSIYTDSSHKYSSIFKKIRKGKKKEKKNNNNIWDYYQYLNIVLYYLQVFESLVPGDGMGWAEGGSTLEC